MGWPEVVGAAVFSGWPCLAARLSHRVGGVPRALAVSFRLVGLGLRWSSWREGVEAADRRGEVAGPGGVVDGGDPVAPGVPGGVEGDGLADAVVQDGGQAAGVVEVPLVDGGGGDFAINLDLQPERGQGETLAASARGLAAIEEARAALAEELNLNPRLVLERAFLHLAEAAA